MADYKESLNEVNEGMGKVAQALPNEMNGFMGLHNAALENKALDPKTKELIALGIAICVRCEPCIISHVDSLIKSGATKQEIEETVGVAVFMGGGPSIMYGSKALTVFEQLSK